MSVSFNSPDPLSMAEYGSVRDCLNNLMKQDVEVYGEYKNVPIFQINAVYPCLFSYNHIKKPAI